MPMSTHDNMKTMAELEKNVRTIVKQVRKTGRPVVVTRNGKPDMALVDALTWQRRIATANLARLLAKGEADVVAGRTQLAMFVASATNGWLLGLTNVKAFGYS